VAACGLAGCDYGPPVDGGQPIAAFERVNRGGSRSPGGVANEHYYEVTPTNLLDAAALRAYFRWRCSETYVPANCVIRAWPVGLAPHHVSALSPQEIATQVALYRFNKATRVEYFTLSPRE
jgi:hypothetical protein